MFVIPLLCFHLVVRHGGVIFFVRVDLPERLPVRVGLATSLLRGNFCFFSFFDFLFYWYYKVLVNFLFVQIFIFKRFYYLSFCAGKTSTAFFVTNCFIDIYICFVLKNKKLSHAILSKPQVLGTQ